MKPLEVFFTMHPLFVSFIVFANLVDQVGDSYNILYMNNLVAKYYLAWCILMHWWFLMHLSHQPTNNDIGILDIIMGFVILLRFTRQEFYYGLLDMTHVKVLLYHGVTTYITPSLDNLWGQWRIAICSIITRAFKCLKMVSPFS